MSAGARSSEPPLLWLRERESPCMAWCRGLLPPTSAWLQPPSLPSGLFMDWLIPLKASAKASLHILNWQHCAQLLQLAQACWLLLRSSTSKFSLCLACPRMHCIIKLPLFSACFGLSHLLPKPLAIPMCLIPSLHQVGLVHASPFLSTFCTLPCSPFPILAPSSSLQPGP